MLYLRYSTVRYNELQSYYNDIKQLMWNELTSTYDVVARLIKIGMNDSLIVVLRYCSMLYRT